MKRIMIEYLSSGDNTTEHAADVPDEVAMEFQAALAKGLYDGDHMALVPDNQGILFLRANLIKRVRFEEIGVLTEKQAQVVAQACHDAAMVGTDPSQVAQAIVQHGILPDLESAEEVVRSHWPGP